MSKEQLTDIIASAAMSCVMRGQFGEREKNQKLELLSKHRPDVIEAEIASLKRSIRMLEEYLPKETSHDA